MKNDTSAADFWVVLSTPVADRDAYMPHLQEHLAYQRALEERGVLFAAGPLADASGARKGRGLIVLRAESAEHAEAIADADPMHAKGMRTYSLERWTMVEGAATKLLQGRDAGKKRP